MQINLNGNIHADSEPVFTIGNRAFRYGDGLFESIRAFEGRMPFFERHWQRLSTGFGLLKLAPPAFFTPSFFENEIKKLTEGQGNWRIRLTVWRSGDGLYTPESNLPEFLIEAAPLPSPVFELNEIGLKIGIYDQPLPISQSPYTPIRQNLKTSSALPFVLASIFKKENNLDDCLLLNTAGQVACGSSSNVFLAKNGELLTPPLTEGCVAGTMRAALLDLAKQLGNKAAEVPIALAELGAADEIFLTNAIQGIRWVRQVEGVEKRYNPSMSKYLVEEINRRFLLG